LVGLVGSKSFLHPRRRGIQYRRGNGFFVARGVRWRFDHVRQKVSASFVVPKEGRLIADVGIAPVKHGCHHRFVVVDVDVAGFKGVVDLVRVVICASVVL